MTKVERFIELQSKVTSVGLNKKEAEELQRLSQIVTEQDVAALRDLEQQQQESQWQLWLTRVYQKARNADNQILKQCESNENIFREYAGLPFELVIDAIKKDASRFSWTEMPRSKTDQRVLAKDRETLAQAARANGNFGASEANLNLIRDVFGAGFSEYALIQAIRSNAIRGLAPPSQEERDSWEEELLDKEKLRLLNASIPALKEEVREQFDQRRAAAHAAETDRVLQEKKQFQQWQFKPLPRTWNGQRLDADAIRRASPQQIRKWKELFGSLQLDLRLRGEN